MGMGLHGPACVLHAWTRHLILVRGLVNAGVQSLDSPLCFDEIKLMFWKCLSLINVDTKRKIEINKSRKRYSLRYSYMYMTYAFYLYLCIGSFRSDPHLFPCFGGGNHLTRDPFWSFGVAPWCDVGGVWQGANECRGRESCRRGKGEAERFEQLKGRMSWVHRDSW